jgi:hypothetical protein
MVPAEHSELWLRLTHPALLPFVKPVAPRFFHALKLIAKEERPVTSAPEGALATISPSRARPNHQQQEQSEDYQPRHVISRRVPT